MIRPKEFGFKFETYLQGLSLDRKKAVNTVLAWVQSKRHCREVLEYMGVNIPQGDSAVGKARRMEQNKHYIIEYLEGLGVGARQWQEWHSNLPDEADPSAHGEVKKRKSPADYA